MFKNIKLDLSLLLPVLLCAAISLTMLVSISPDRVLSQAVFFVIGIGIFLYLSSFDYSLYEILADKSYFIAIFLLLITFVIGEAVRGSLRWIPLGSFNLQTSEIAKPLLILAFSHYLKKYPPVNFVNILKNFALFLLPFIIIFLQPDLGSALVIASIFFFQLFVAGLPWVYVGLGGIFAGIGFKFSHLFLHDYQLARLESFIDPYKDPLGSGYNVIQSVIAIGSGGFFGKGLGKGTQSHLRFLPERHTDFMFASLSEELGMVGGLVALLALVSILWKMVNMALVADQGQRLIVSGIFGYFFFQTFINIGMNLGLAPVTGVTLPLISYGGSSILGVFLTLGIAGSLSRRLNKPASLEIK